MCKRLQKILRIGLAYPFLERVMRFGWYGMDGICVLTLNREVFEFDGCKQSELCGETWGI